MSVRLGGLAQKDPLAWLTTQVGGLSHLGRPTHLRSASGCRFCIPRSTSGCKFCIWGQPQDATFASEVDLRISWGCWQKVQPTAEINNKSLEVPKTLQKLLSPHPFPLSQGRIILPLDLQTDASVNHVLSAKTVFSHYLSQCYAQRPAQHFFLSW